MTGYPILEEPDVADYLRARGLLPAGTLTVREVSDGNMNRVFLAKQEETGQSVAVKQALPWVRVAGPSWPMNPDRIDAEARAYRQMQRFTPALIPEILHYDKENYVLVMEDLSGFRVQRDLLNAGASFADTSTAIGVFVAGLTFGTSDFGLASAERKALIAESVSPELSKITEDVVLSEPYLEHEHNHWLPELSDLATQFRADAQLRTEVSQLRHIFLTSAQALLHGDLHTGSIMVGDKGVRVFDPEFSIVGPIGYDLGLYFANAIAAEARAAALGAITDHADQITLTWTAFEREFRRLWPTRVDTFYDDAFLDRFLAQVLAESVGFAGTELVRRIIGYAHLTDLETAPAQASRAALRVGRDLIVRRAELTTTESIRALITGYLKEIA